MERCTRWRRISSPEEGYKQSCVANKEVVALCTLPELSRNQIVRHIMSDSVPRTTAISVEVPGFTLLSQQRADRLTAFLEGITAICVEAQTVARRTERHKPYGRPLRYRLAKSGDRADPELVFPQIRFYRGDSDPTGVYVAPDGDSRRYGSGPARSDKSDSLRSQEP